jgi:hypothetical protein
MNDSFQNRKKAAHTKIPYQMFPLPSAFFGLFRQCHSKDRLFKTERILWKKGKNNVALEGKRARVKELSTLQRHVCFWFLCTKSGISK